MRRVYVAGAICALGVVLGTACGSGAQQVPPPEDPTTSGSARLTRFPTCHWVPVKPETEDVCDYQNKGSTVQATIREDNRPESARKTTATCDCE